MDELFASAYKWGTPPGREQNLLVGISKHLYLLKNGTLRWQKRALDPRIPGKRLLRRMVLFDVGAGTLYGECDVDDHPKDLIGFLARAWALKPDHPMRGVPQVLNVSRLVRNDDTYAAQLRALQQIVPFAIGEVPSGFAAGVHAVKLFENRLTDLMGSASWHDMVLALEMAQACSALIMSHVSTLSQFFTSGRWEDVAAPDQSFLDAVDRLYDPPGGWREYPYDMILEGAPKKGDSK